MDYPHSSKARKYFLVLNVGQVQISEDVLRAQGLVEERNPDQVIMGGRVNPDRFTKKAGKHRATRREKVMKMKDRQRRQGRDVRKDSKYTGRQRRTRF